MAFYFNSTTKAFYDTDVFPVASLPANSVEITEAVYSELMTKQNQGYVILADNSGNPYAVAQSEATATDIKHAASVATTVALGHVKIGDTMTAANDGTLDLKDGAVTTAKIVDANVTADKLATDSVTTAKIANQNVTTEKLADGAVTTAKIVDANVTADKLATDSVTTAKIANQNVTTEKLADGAVTEDKLEFVKALVADESSLTMIEQSGGFVLSIKDDGVTTDEIADSAVTGAKLATDSVTQTKIMDGQVTRSKFAEESCSSVIVFTDSDGNALNGTTKRLQYSGNPVEIGRTQLILYKDIVDFTIAFDWGDVLDPISNIQFKLIVWAGNDIDHATYKYERTVSTSQVFGDNYALHCQERFSFIQGVAASAKVHISIDLLNSTSWMKLVNIQLNGIRAPGY